MKIKNLGNNIYKLENSKIDNRLLKINDKFTFLDSKIDFYQNDYSYFIYDSFVDTEHVSTLETSAKFDRFNFMFVSTNEETQIVTNKYNVNLDSLNIQLNIIDPNKKVETLPIYIKLNEEWVEVEENKDIKFEKTYDSFKLKIEIPDIENIYVDSFTIYLNKKDKVELTDNSTLKLIKDTAENKYKVDLYSSYYKDMFVDSFINKDYIEKLKGLYLDEDYSITLKEDSFKGELITKPIYLDEKIMDCKILIDAFKEKNIEIEMSNNNGNNWIDVKQNSKCEFLVGGKIIKVKFKFSENEPNSKLYSYGILF